MARFQLINAAGHFPHGATGVSFEADSARDACRMLMFMSFEPHPSIENLQAICDSVPQDSPLRGPRFWHGLPEHTPEGRIAIDTIDADDDRCSKYCPRCRTLIPRWWVSLPMDAAERCGHCDEDRPNANGLDASGRRLGCGCNPQGNKFTCLQHAIGRYGPCGCRCHAAQTASDR